MPDIGYVGPGLPHPKSAAADGRFLFTSEVKKDETLVIDSMIQILLTRRGERAMNPEFGSKLHLIPFDQDITPLINSVAERYVREAIQQWEPRAEVIGVEVFRANPNEIAVRVAFSMLKIGQPGQFTFRMRA